jgi:hypothetical protein
LDPLLGLKYYYNFCGRFNAPIGIQCCMNEFNADELLVSIKVSIEFNEGVFVGVGVRVAVRGRSRQSCRR